jgi:(1->4)-alpha-D-glucan 1-alpha-D-glucosylmutase
MRVDPRATYRVQLHPGFDFDAAAEIVPYLAELGISHLYSSPCLQAAPGSMHGYDVVDYHVSHELGGTAGHERLDSALRGAAMGRMLDIVPNHMAITGRENPWWWDVLENGPASPYSAYFDVDWAPPEARLRNSVLLPVLGDHYGRLLEAGEIKLVREDGGFILRYYERVFPVAPRSLDSLLGRAAQRSGNDELAFIADSLTSLPFSTDRDPASLRRRERDVAVLKTTIGRLVQSLPDVAKAIDETVAEFNADHDLLHAMLERQNYRLAFWRAAGRDLGYRRFFDISNLIGLRMENEQVFNDTHSLVLRWLLEGVLDGVRVDHIDGLRDPHAYLQRLSAAAPKAWIVVEKILQPGERLRESWPVGGTTGYDFLNCAGGLFVDPAGEAPLTQLYTEFTGQPSDFGALAYACKEMVARDLLGSELNRLTELFVEVCEHDRRHRDYTRHELHEALVAVVARFAVYRTYCREDSSEPDPEDVRYVDQAVAQAKADRADLDPELFDFLRQILLLREKGEFHIEMALGFQQYTGPVMAKALEDTAFYRYHRLICLNEVGGDPARFGISPGEFHQASQERRRRWSLGLLATSTHDTKRSEDVRARLAVLSEMPEQWVGAVRRWSELNRRHWQAAPDRNAEYMLYQALTGAWPIGVERVWAFMEKAAREAKAQTSWTKPDSGYEGNLHGFVEGVMGDSGFAAEIEAFVASLLPFARINSIAQTLLKLTSPGIPDFYQGTELWDFSLVDPDNRRPVDYSLRRRMLAAAKCASTEEVLKHPEEGLPKLFVIYRTLGVRKLRPELFASDAAYEPLGARGVRAGHVVAFMRASAAITVVPRLVFGLAGRWEDTTLEIPAGRWRDELSGDVYQGGIIQMSRLTARFPLSLLIREERKP